MNEFEKELEELRKKYNLQCIKNNKFVAFDEVLELTFRLHGSMFVDVEKDNVDVIKPRMLQALTHMKHMLEADIEILLEN